MCMKRDLNLKLSCDRWKLESNVTVISNTVIILCSNSQDCCPSWTKRPHSLTNHKTYGFSSLIVTISSFRSWVFHRQRTYVTTPQPVMWKHFRKILFKHIFVTRISKPDKQCLRANATAVFRWGTNVQHFKYSYVMLTLPFLLFFFVQSPRSYQHSNTAVEDKESSIRHAVKSTKAEPSILPD